jgi:hypothetical protein
MSEIAAEYPTWWRNHGLTPLASLAFVTPLIACYELGVIALGPDAVRNGCDVWLRQLLQWSGFGQYFLLPMLACFCLLGMHYISRQPWVVAVDSLVRMAWESLLFAAVLLLTGHLHGWCYQEWTGRHAALNGQSQLSMGAADCVSYIGAGIYEELLFRLLLIPLLAGCLLSWGESRESSWFTAAMASSLFFAAAHYSAFVGVGDAFTWSTFLFRWVAGLIFAGLFYYRGFGVTAGAHVLYDILASATARV